MPKGLTRSPHLALPQLGRRFAEIYMSGYVTEFYSSRPVQEGVVFSVKHKEGPMPPLCEGTQFKKAFFPTFQLSLDLADSCFGTKTGGIYLALNFVMSPNPEQRLVVCKRFMSKTDFFSTPFKNSSQFGIFTVSKLSSTIETKPVSAVTHKYVRLPFRDDFVVLPLLQTTSKS